MTSRSFVVETRAQAVAIFGGPAELVGKLIQEFESCSVHALAISSLPILTKLIDTHDPDYLVIFPDISLDEFAPVLQPLIESGQSRLITVAHSSQTLPELPPSPIAIRIVFSDYVGDEEIFSPAIELWLTSIKANASIAIPGDGLSELSLLGVNDLVRLLAISILRPAPKSTSQAFLGNPNPTSLLNLAYLIRTTLPFKINLSFASTEVIQTPLFDQDGCVNTLEKLDYHLAESPDDLFKIYLKTHVKEAPVPQSASKLPTPEPHVVPAKKLTPLKTTAPVFIPLQTKKRPINFADFIHGPSRPLHSGPIRLRSIVGRGLIIGLALYLGTLAFASTIVGLSLRHTASVLQRNEIPTSSKLNSFSLTYLQANWIALTSFPGLAQKQKIVDLTLLLDAYHQSLSALDTANLLSKSTETLLHYVFGSGNADIAQVISLSRLQAEELYQKLSLLDGSLPADPPGVIPAKYHPAYERGKAKLGVIKRSVTTTKAVLATTPDVIGLGGRRKYAVLFQNNMELRATGGFIGSFAILSFENGKLYDMPIFDVYDADGQLKGHVEPPSAIKDILGEANWYLRDSNFDPDFPTSARRAEWFINKSLNFDLDGTIAVTVNTLSSLLRATGPLVVPDYNETITGDNLYERAQFHAEVNFFPGSTQKKEFLSTVASALFARLPSLGAGDGLKLGAALADSVDQKDTLISLANPTTDHVFQTLGWNGGLNDFPCPTADNCHKDYAMVVDSNFGVNKANYFIKRNIEEVITFTKNLTVDHVLRLRYQNTSTSDAWPAGTYKNYQRLYLPIGTTISKVKVGDKELTGKDYEVTAEHNRAVLSYLVIVPVKETVIVEIQYSSPQLPQENELLYTWYWQKQPGTSKDDNLTLYLNYPMYLKPVVISPPAELASQQLKFNLVNDTDHRVTVKFQK